MASLYSTNATVSSDPHGSISSEDGQLDLKLARPCVFCGRDDATNPEQLFAGGYAACLITHSFMSPGMPATALPTTISTPSQP
jgi:organic hydroperoxide reductase OsmC/OhrA